MPSDRRSLKDPEPRSDRLLLSGSHSPANDEHPKRRIESSGSCDKGDLGAPTTDGEREAEGQRLGRQPRIHCQAGYDMQRSNQASRYLAALLLTCGVVYVAHT